MPDPILDYSVTNGQDVIAASGDPALESLNDADLLREASRQGRVPVTFNIVDFVDAAHAFAHQQEDHAGIILIHSRTFPRTNIGAIARALNGLLQSRNDFVNAVLYLQ